MTDPIEIMALAILNCDRKAGGWPPVESRANIPECHGYGRNAKAVLSALTEAGYAIVPKDRLDDANIMLAIHGLETVPIVINAGRVKA
ncbi:hypothetical protein [Sphingopyxis sp. PET50]|uniref:hypothetical protein n=1 Tax=Sphingopyxis sp. PET50 TaxID=2976533 RepID=UPI0021AFDE09|nr:hypothetical protein [Sphingopyxis sp. PET50]